jgi:predicted transcriptional regulator
MAMTLRLKPEVDQALTEFATTNGISKAQAAANAIESYLEQQSTEVITRKAFEIVLERDAELLRRLADS